MRYSCLQRANNSYLDDSHLTIFTLKTPSQHAVYKKFLWGKNKSKIKHDTICKLHCWEFLKVKYPLSQNIKVKWFQLTQALPKEWKEAISMHDRSLENLLSQDHYLIKKNEILCLTKLNSNEL